MLNASGANKRWFTAITFLFYIRVDPIPSGYDNSAYNSVLFVTCHQHTLSFKDVERQIDSRAMCVDASVESETGRR